MNSIQRPDSSQSLSLRTKAAKSLNLMPIEKRIERSVSSPTKPVGNPSNSPYLATEYPDHDDWINSLPATSAQSSASSSPTSPLGEASRESPTRRMSSCVSSPQSENFGNSKSTLPGRRGSAMAHALRHFSCLSMDLTNHPQYFKTGDHKLSRSQSTKVKSRSTLGVNMNHAKDQNDGELEQSHLESLRLELKSLRQECEQIKVGNEKADSVLRNMTTILNRIKELASCQPQDVANKLRNEADDLEAIFTSALENLRSDSPVLDSSVESISTPSSTRRRSIYSTVIPLEEIEKSHSSIVVVNPTSPTEEETSDDSDIAVKHHKEAANRSSDATLRNPIIVETKAPCNESLKTTYMDNLSVSQRDDDSEISDEGEEGLFCYVKGSAQRAAAAQRPVSRAQANRHSAIIGDSLFSLWAFDDDKSDSQTVSQPLSPCTVKSEDIDDPLLSTNPQQITACQPQLPRGYAIAITKPRGPHSTCERPSEDSPTMTCKVDLDAQGGGYVRQKFASTKVMGRSSSAAYQNHSLA